MVFAGSSPITTTSLSSNGTRSRGPFLSQHYAASTVIRPRPTPGMAATLRDVEAATLALDGSPPVTASHPFQRAASTIPADRVGARVDCLPTCAAFPKMTGVSASALELSRPAWASLCCGPSDRSAAQGRLRRKAPTQPVTQPCRLPASRPIDDYPGETLPH
jgi:hypothetical protein